ncbi:MAG: hypothetical protein WA960_01655 [Tunicatimonas sp.]
MLVELFDQQTDPLRKEIRKAIHLENVITATNSVLHHIRSEIRREQGADELSLDRLIAQIKASVLLILSATEVKAWKKEPGKGAITLIGHAKYQSGIKIFQALIMLGLIVFFWLAQPENYQLLVGASLAVVLGELFLHFVNLRHERKEVKRAKRSRSEEEDVRYDVLVDPDAYISHLRQLLIAADKLLPLLNSKNLEPSGNLIEQDKNLLELFQGMVEAADNQDRELAMLNSKRVAGLLSKYNFKLVYYDGQNNDLFDFFPNLKNEEVETVYPALVKDDKIISMGRVVSPQVTHK